MGNPAPTVFVVDDNEAMRKSLQWLIESEGLTVATFASAKDFLDRYQPGWAGCMVLDIRMPGMSGMELLDALSLRQIDLPVIMITGHGDVPTAVRAMKNGVLDFLQKPFQDEDLLRCIGQALACGAEVRRNQLCGENARALIAALTPREREIMSMVAAGKPNKAVAREVGISTRTVEVHRARIMLKLQVRNIADLVALNLRYNSG